MAAADFWLFLAGVALFIMGIRQLEEGLQRLAGRSFKLFLRKNSNRSLRAIFSGTVVTMLLQSSSVVNLLVLAFVGAGIIGMQNALALILGANLGTTATSWMIAIVGFELNIEAVALPMVGVAGILYFALRQQSTVAKWLLLMLGFGLMFTGLGFIKSGMEDMVKGFDLAAYQNAGALLFLLIGFVLTTIIQSSSATMAIALSMLATGSISLTQAMALALGSEVGTTMKVVLAAIGGHADKKRVALGNFLFNLVSTVAFLFWLEPCGRFITQQLGIQSNLLALVMFQTLVNLSGIIAFLPFLKPLGRGLQKLFRKGDRKSIFISNRPIEVPDISLELLRSEVLSLLQHVLIFGRTLFGSREPDVHTHYYQKEFDNLPLDKQYEYIKIQHGEVFDYYIRLQAGNLQTQETVLAERLITAARNAVYAAKSFKDTMSDVEEFSESGKDKKFMLFAETQQQTVAFAANMERMLFETSANKAADLLSFYTQVQQHYSLNIRHIYTGIVTEGLQEIEVTSAINLNREITTAFKSLTMAAKDLLLDEKEAAAFEELPGFIR